MASSSSRASTFRDTTSAPKLDDVMGQERTEMAQSGARSDASLCVSHCTAEKRSRPSVSLFQTKAKVNENDRNSLKFFDEKFRKF
eukprot:scaffold959_cov258-Pinguiococcus_pyrenoidosus.AAC.4